jgi:hypothetical protein
MVITTHFVERFHEDVIDWQRHQARDDEVENYGNNR